MNAERWRVEYHRSLEKEIRQLPKLYIRRILKTIESLADDPRPYGSEKLAGEEIWRIRVGPYRILYTIDDALRVVRTYCISHRRDVYRDI